MTKKPSPRVQFDILLKSPGSGQTANVNNIDQFHPAPETVEKCRRWLTEQGVNCYVTGFGLACDAPVEVFETLFATRLRRVGKAAGTAPWHCASPPEPPREIQEYVEQISLAPPPELF